MNFFDKPQNVLKIPNVNNRVRSGDFKKVVKYKKRNFWDVLKERLRNY